MSDLGSKIALVTGGNGGIGLGMARGLAQAGATLIILGRNAEKSAAALHELQSLGCQAQALPCDVADEAAVQRLFADVRDRHGRLDILINNAGSTVRKPPQDFTLEEWNTVMDVNLTSAFLCCRAAYPLMLAAGARAQVPGLNERVLARTPAGRWGAPQDLAGIAVFLASGASDFVTATAIPVDGGYAAA